MKIHHLRNATFVIESGLNHILIDPMLSRKGQLPTFTHFRHKPARNPIVPLPDNALKFLDKVTHCFITHSQKLGIELLTHTDHLDTPGKVFLRKKGIPVVSHKKDAAYLEKNKINVDKKLSFWQVEPLLGGQITAVPSKHGHSWIHNFMATGTGFYLELPDEPTIYISGDTVYTGDVHRVLTEFKPDICVVASGSASLDMGGPILMPLDEIISFIEKAPNKVISNHLEALNHCPTTRLQLKQELEKRGLLSKTFIPNDGETLTIEIS
ncbi:MAG: MBL fold metallo-hydrolase [Desulfobacteraceae bacterium]|nr:MBL fold metallo-hydrolase [Desulfobacteraceae bacterium]